MGSLWLVLQLRPLCTFCSLQQLRVPLLATSWLCTKFIVIRSVSLSGPPIMGGLPLSGLNALGPKGRGPWAMGFGPRGWGCALGPGGLGPGRRSRVSGPRAEDRGAGPRAQDLGGWAQGLGPGRPGPRTWAQPWAQGWAQGVESTSLWSRFDSNWNGFYFVLECNLLRFGVESTPIGVESTSADAPPALGPCDGQQSLLRYPFANFQRVTILYIRREA